MNYLLQVTWAIAELGSCDTNFAMCFGFQSTRNLHQIYAKIQELRSSIQQQDWLVPQQTKFKKITPSTVKPWTVSYLV